MTDANKARWFEVVRVLEGAPKSGDPAAIRIELLRSIDQSNTYRFNVWRMETFEMRPAFGPAMDQPIHEGVLVDWNHALVSSGEDFTAESIEDALRVVLEQAADLLLTSGVKRE
jgi:hypothetical protein